jgi:hypothetical protein
MRFVFWKTENLHALPADSILPGDILVVFPKPDNWQATRTLADWSFKVVGWIVIVATFYYAYQKTHSTLLLGISLVLFALVASFIYGLVEWVYLIQFIPHGELLAARLAASAPPKPTSLTKKLWRIGVRLLVAFSILGAGSFGTMIALKTVIDAIVEFQKNPKS